MGRHSQPPVYITPAVVGAQRILNSPIAPLNDKGLAAWREMKKQTGLSTQQMNSYLGSRHRFPSQKDIEEAEQSRRLAAFSQ